MKTHRMSLGDDGTLDNGWAVMPQPIDTADAEVTAAIQALENLWAQVDNASAPFCGCETIRHFDGNAGHPYGRANGSTRPTTVWGLVGDPFCEECQRICEPAILDGKPLPLD